MCSQVQLHRSTTGTLHLYHCVAAAAAAGPWGPMQVSEAELEAIARMGDAAALDVEMAAAGAGGAATRALLGEYTTPARCARAGTGFSRGVRGKKAEAVRKFVIAYWAQALCVAGRSLHSHCVYVVPCQAAQASRLPHLLDGVWCLLLVPPTCRVPGAGLRRPCAPRAPPSGVRTA